MNPEKLNDWLQVIGTFGLIASLVFVGFELQQNAEIATDDVYDSITVNTVELAALISENADVWSRACLGEELTDAERLTAGQIFYAWGTANYITWKRFAIADLSDADPQFLIDSYAANIYRYPGLRILGRSMLEWDANGRQFPDADVARYLQGIRDRLSELAEIEPDPLVDVTWCGRL